MGDAQGASATAVGPPFACAAAAPFPTPSTICPPQVQGRHHRHRPPPWRPRRWRPEQRREGEAAARRRCRRCRCRALSCSGAVAGLPAGCLRGAGSGQYERIRGTLQRSLAALHGPGCIPSRTRTPPAPAPTPTFASVAFGATPQAAVTRAVKYGDEVGGEGGMRVYSKVGRPHATPGPGIRGGCSSTQQLFSRAPMLRDAHATAHPPAAPL